MIYIFNHLDRYTNQVYNEHLCSLPSWRKEKALQYKKLDDRKRSVLAFVLLQHALREEYGIIEIPEFVYNEFGKPWLPNVPIYFSLSHCQNAVVCAVSDHNIGIDVEGIVQYNSDIARRICTLAELEILEQSENKEVDFIKIWTIKEAISKYQGLGLTLAFNKIHVKDYTIHSWSLNNSHCVISVCYGPNNMTRKNKLFEINYYHCIDSTYGFV